MSASKDYYSSMGWTTKAEIKQKHPTLDLGTQFTISNSSRKVNIGKWEITSNSNAPYYKCRRLLKSGSYASWSINNERTFSEEEIYNKHKL